MCTKLFTAFFLIVALAAATVVTFMKGSMVKEMLMVMRFFEIMLPILGVGALLKYICCCKK